MTTRLATTRMLVLSLALIVLFLTMAVAAYLSGRSVERDSEFISADAVPGSIQAHAMQAALINCMSEEVLAAVTTADGSRTLHLDLAAKADAAFRQELLRYKATMHINPARDQELMAKLAERFATFTQKREAFEALLNVGDRAARLAFLENELIPAYADVSGVMDEVVAYNHTNALHYVGTISDSIRLLRGTVVVIVILAVICGMILAGNLVVRRREEQQLREHALRLRQVLDNLFAFVGLLELDGTIVEANSATLRAAGVRREDVIGRQLAETYWWNFSPEVQARLRAALAAAAAGQVVRYDTEVRVAGDNRLMIDFGCGPMRNAEGRITHIVTTAVDVSERKKLEQQFLRAQRMEAIGALSSGLAHDLNNILAPMLMAAGLLKMTVTSPRDQGIITLIERGAQRGADIIRQLLTFGRGSEGARGPTQVRHLLRDIAHIIRETFPRSIELDLVVAGDLWPIVTDATQLHQMVLNLCVNARDAMPAGGTLTLRAENRLLDAQHPLPDGEGKVGRHVVITVADTGEGIPAEIIPRIFDPFFTTKLPGKGTGLGLASVMSIVKGHDGFVDVQSEPGKGTTFTVCLPATTALAATAAEAPDHLPGGQGELILVVDDEASIRETTRAVLEQHNYRVITAANGEEAVRAFIGQRDAVRLVLTDLDMPVMDGPELIRSLRVVAGDLKFVLITGSARTVQERELAAWGAQAILRKPCDPAQLLRTLQQILQSSRER
jgi:two-component system cell cycle sensor histidine kinase/response regulator CckA